jgi:hypothetical protein
MWLAATVTLITLVSVILGLAASLALSVAQLLGAMGQRDELPRRVGSSARHAVESGPAAPN